jgi:hypothetical protein
MAEKSAPASHGQECKKHPALKADILVPDASFETLESIIDNGETVESIIDTRSPVSFMTEEEYLANFSHFQLHRVSRSFMASLPGTRGKIRYKPYINAIISMRGTHGEIIWLWGKIHIVGRVGMARMLIGMNILKQVNAVIALSSSGNDILRINGVSVPARSSRQSSPPSWTP